MTDPGNPSLSPPKPSLSVLSRVFYGWWILLLGSVIIAVGSGIFYHGFTIFFLPLKRDLAVSSAAISLLYGAARLEGGAEGPLVGYLIDRLGPRFMMIAGAALAGVGLVLLSFVQSFWAFFFIYIFVISLGYNASFYHPVYALVNSWFVRYRGFGFAITGVASSAGGMLITPLLGYLVYGYGWRTAAVCAGIFVLAVVIPSALPTRRNPELMGLLPDGKAAVDSPMQKGVHAPELNFSVREALRTPDYWLLFFAIALRVLVTVALTIHFVPILVWKGVEESACAYLVSLFAFGTIPMTLLYGWMGDRWNKSFLSSIGILPLIVGLLVLIFSPPPLSIYALPVTLAVTMGTVPLNWALIGDLFGRMKYATLRGIVGIGNGVGTFLSPLYAGWMFDETGTYRSVLVTFAFCHATALVLFGILFVRSRRKAA
ncbi:MAG TPA: MFS transporter [Thermodesulfobacteriota bacterium]|nr:MFS transporter [Thermodesulfobacteriota bacterium]